jgi:hypothetical protein
MGGYGARKDVSKGIHHPLLAKVLLIRSEGKQFGLVTFDLLVMLSPRIAREAKRVGIDPILQIASHTHFGPVPKRRQTADQDPWCRSVEEKVVSALKDVAVGSVTMDLISVGSSALVIGWAS